MYEVVLFVFSTDDLKAVASLQKSQEEFGCLIKAV